VALTLAVLIVLLTASMATAQDATRLAMARVRLTTDPKVPVGCTTLGMVADDSLEDLRRRVVRLGGDTALLSFPVERLAQINAVVFRCASAAATPPAPTPGPAAATPAPPPPPAPPSVPPPAGAPPPPPPAGSAPPPR
jgi:hypothetical protein